jgi:hypothetical protein
VARTRAPNAPPSRTRDRTPSAPTTRSARSARSALPAALAEAHGAVGRGLHHLGAEAALDARLGAERVEQHAVQRRAAQHEQARRRGGGGEQGAAGGVGDARAGGLAGGVERRAQPERLEHRHAVLGDGDAGADGARTGDPLDEGDAGAGAGEQQRGRAAADGAARDDDVQVLEVHGGLRWGVAPR